MSPQLSPSSGVYNLCPEMSTDYNYLQLFKTHRVGKQNKFLTEKCTFPGTGTQVSTYNLLLSRYCISGNLATLPETYKGFSICVYYYFSFKNPAFKNIKMKFWCDYCKVGSCATCIWQL